MVGSPRCGRGYRFFDIDQVILLRGSAPSAKQGRNSGTTKRAAAFLPIGAIDKPDPGTPLAGMEGGDKVSDALFAKQGVRRIFFDRSQWPKALANRQ